MGLIQLRKSVRIVTPLVVTITTANQKTTKFVTMKIPMRIANELNLLTLRNSMINTDRLICFATQTI
jgi:hypothetical protein